MNIVQFSYIYIHIGRFIHEIWGKTYIYQTLADKFPAFALLQPCIINKLPVDDLATLESRVSAALLLTYLPHKSSGRNKQEILWADLDLGAWYST